MDGVTSEQFGGHSKSLLEKLDRQIQQFQSTHPCRVRQRYLTLFCKNKVSTDIEYTINSLYFHFFSYAFHANLLTFNE